MGTKAKFLSICEIQNEYKEYSADTFLIVIDKRVYDLYHSKIDFENFVEDKEIITWIAPEGESVKSFYHYSECLEFFLKKGVHRNAHLIAIGGGATSDFAGFVASTILRGIEWSIIPTTLLSMVDASIGGKVAINSESGKNLVGAFHLPTQVYIDQEFLGTLPDDEFLSGMGEIIKYGLLDREIFSALSREVSHQTLIKQCIDFKSKIVDADLYEGGIRKLLNFGHTVGHAFEVAWSYPHGIAVILGIDFILRFYEQDELRAKFYDIAKKMGISDPSAYYRKDADIEQLINLVTVDKKLVDRESIELIVLKDIGYHMIQTEKLSEFIEKSRKILGEVCK